MSGGRSPEAGQVIAPEAETGPVRRAVLVTATETEPRTYGKPVVIGGILDHLCDRLGPANVHVVLIGRPGVLRPEVPYRRLVLDRPGPARQVVSVLRHVVLPPGRRPGAYRHPLQEAVLYSGSLAGRLAAAIAEINPDLEVWDTVRMGQYQESADTAGSPVGASNGRKPFEWSRNRRVRRILYADDLFSERYAALLADGGDGRAGGPGNPGGEFARSLLPRPAARLLASPRVHRPLLRLERRLVADSEARQPAWFDATYLISPEETARLRARVPGAEIGTLPPLLSGPRPAAARRYEGAHEFVFMGGFDYAPNRDGLDWFLRTCGPAVRSRLPGAVITVAGSGTERGLASAASWGDAVRFRGWVPDLDELLAGCAALLSPLRTGSGVKIKVLEALSRGVPVIATPAGVGGVAAGPESGCLVGETPEALAEAMARAVDPELNRWLSAGALTAWRTGYAPEVVRRRYDEIFGLR